jgi:hypothetical protein
MVSSNYFNNYDDLDEQDLISELVAETVHNYGQDCWYVPRTVHNRDSIFTEGEYHSFNQAYLLEFYIKSSSQMGGEGALLSKFGVEVRDEMVLTVAKRTFQTEVLDVRPDLLRPREGDLVFVPMVKAAFTIKYVDKKAFFYQMGDLQAYDLTLELYENSGAEFDTGIEAIDSIYGNDGGAAGVQSGGTGAADEILDGITFMTENGLSLLDERDGWLMVLDDTRIKDDLSQNVEIEDEAEKILNWSETDPFSEGGKF